MAWPFVFTTASAFTDSTVKTLNTNGLGTFFISQTGGKTPPAALVHFSGQSLNSKAYVIGCGHCNGMPKDDYVYNQTLSNKNVYLFNKQGKQKPLAINKLVFGTQTHVDFVLLELKETYQEILDKHGIESRLLSNKVYGYDTNIYFYNLEKTLDCTINQVNSEFDIPDNEARIILLDAYLYFNKCQSIPGYSGSILISKETNEVIGLNVGGFPETEHLVITYVSFASNVHQLYSCMNSEFQIDLDKKDCKLKINNLKNSAKDYL